MESILNTLAENPVIEPKELPPSPTVEAEALLPTQALQETSVDGDDDCVICYETMYRPATTDCGHSACQTCLLHWCLTAMEVTLDDQQLATSLVIDGIKFKCPTCRTYTAAAFDAEKNEKLKARYPDDYAARAADSGSSTSQPPDECEPQTMVLMFGNSHRKVPPSISPYTGKTRTHEWTFFVQSSRQDLVEQVSVILHPTFRGDRLVTLKQAPFSTTHLGWGYFTIFAGVQLKEGYQWIDEDRAVDSDAEKGRKNDILPIEWLLDFRGNGSQRNRIVKFRKMRNEEQGKTDAEDAKLDLGPLAELMSEAEIAEYREMKKLRNAASRAREEPRSA